MSRKYCSDCYKEALRYSLYEITVLLPGVSSKGKKKKKVEWCIKTFRLIFFT